MLVQVEFFTNGSSTVLGNFGPGDRVRVKPDMARHLVEEARCARYVDSPPAVPAVDGAAVAKSNAPAKPRVRPKK